ncbi:PaaI family thioesterase, partial [Streptomyces avermitilis]|uniref:PaaI family thioesterase n=1 Tax=Streptomyces avermitilis TaxID=33903 RepID=UPI0033CAD04D
APTNTNADTTTLSSRSPRDQRTRVHYHGGRPGIGYTTLELKVNYIRAARTDGQLLTAEGTVIHAGRRTATAEGKVLDGDGKLIAHATTTCLILQG